MISLLEPLGLNIYWRPTNYKLILRKSNNTVWKRYLLLRYLTSHGSKTGEKSSNSEFNGPKELRKSLKAAWVCSRDKRKMGWIKNGLDHLEWEMLDKARMQGIISDEIEAAYAILRTNDRLLQMLMLLSQIAIPSNFNAIANPAAVIPFHSNIVQQSQKRTNHLKRITNGILK